MPVRPTRVRRLRIRKAMGNAVLASVVLAAGLAYIAVQKTVTLIVDEGHPEAVRTMSTSVGDLLDAEGIVLGAGDLVTPASVTPLADGMTVLVDRGWVTATTDASSAEDVGVWVMEGVSAPHLMLAARSTEAWFAVGAPGGPSSVVAATVVVKGKDHDVVTNAATVRELLSAMGIEPDGDDRVLPSPRTSIRNEMRIQFDRVAFRTEDIRVPIPYTTSTEYTDRLDAGEVRMIRPGIAGVMIERTRTRFVNGEAVERVVLSRTVVTEAVPALRQVGRADTSAERSGRTQVGEASWYGFAPGDGLTAAHPWLPFGTVVTVRNLANGRTVQVVINDRGPFGGRIIDLSDQAFARIAPLSEGVCQVRLTW
jgi:resuscitation-promoting factor RpfB